MTAVNATPRKKNVNSIFSDRARARVVERLVAGIISFRILFTRELSAVTGRLDY
jgi:hypothetical protein